MNESFRKFVVSEGGSWSVFLIMWVPVVAGLGGLAVDASIGFDWRAKLQATADSTAHAAVIDLPNINAAKATAHSYAAKGVDPDVFGTVLKDADFEAGNWNQNTRIFTANGSPLDAVRVTLRSTAANSNPVATTFLRLVGVNSWDVIASAVAEATSDSCLQNGFSAGGEIFSGSQNSYVNQFCIHAEMGVHVGSQNNFGEGVQVSMADLEDLEQGSDNAGLDDALLEQSDPPALPSQINDLINAFISGAKPMPAYITSGPIVVGSLPSTPAPGTFYVVNSVVDFGSDANIQNIAVVSNYEIKVGSKSNLNNVLLATRNKLSVGSENQIGAANYCVTGTGGVHLFAAGDYITFGSQNSYSGVQIAAAGDVNLGSELASVTGISVQAGGDITYGSQETFGACSVTPIQLSADIVIRIVD